MLLKYFWVDSQYINHGWYQSSVEDFKQWLSKHTRSEVKVIVVILEDERVFLCVPHSNTKKVHWQQLTGVIAVDYFKWHMSEYGLSAVTPISGSSSVAIAGTSIAQFDMEQFDS